MLMTDIHIRTFTGNAIRSYLPMIAKLRVDVFREYPYLKEPDLVQETQYLIRFSQHREAVAVLVFDNATLVGVSLGIPFSQEPAELQKPFLDKGLSPMDYFFFGDSALLKPYRRRGIGHHFFDIRETHVQQCKKYPFICFCVPKQNETDPQRPADYLFFDHFWRKRGYVPASLSAELLWKKLGETSSTPQEMLFWTKNLSQVS